MNSLGANLVNRPVLGGPIEGVVALIHPGSASINVGNWSDYLTALYGGGAADAFSRLRVSNTGQRFDSTFAYDKQPLVFDEIAAGNGAASHDTDLRAVYLTTGGTNTADEVAIRQKHYSPYTPGNSQLIAITGTLNPDNSDWTNARAEIGYGDDNNGVGFRYDENGASIFLRSSISGSASDLTNVAQADWNVNKASSVDWTKSQIFLIDFQSLAVGLIRFYLDRAGVLTEVHRIRNDNLRTGPYWQLASLPVYWKVENTGTANEACRILAICATVKSEGGVDIEDLPGFHFSAYNSSLTAVSTTVLPLLSIRVETTFNSLPNHTLIWPLAINGFANDQPATFVLIKNGSLTNASFAQVHANSCVYSDTAATAISGGRTIGTFFVPAGNRGGAAYSDYRAKSPLTVYDGPTGDILTVAAVRTGSVNANVTASIDWREVR